MSNLYLTWAWYHATDLTPVEKMVLISLADQANDDGECRPSQSWTAKRCNCRRQTVVKHIGTLKKKGYLELHRGKGNRVSYTLISDPSDLVRKTDIPCPKNGHLHYRETHNEPRRASPSIDPSDAIEADKILKQYPGYRLTTKERAMCRGQIYNLMKQGLGLDTLADIMEDFTDCYELATSAGARPRPWHPLKFFSDIERVVTPAIWRQVLAVGIDEDDWETALYRNGIAWEPRVYGEKAE